MSWTQFSDDSIAGKSIESGTPADQEILKYDAAQDKWLFASDASGLPSLTDGRIWIGDGTNTAVSNTMSGDGTLSNTGVLTVLQANLDTTGGNPAYSEGLFFYDRDNKSAAIYNDESDVTHQLGQEFFVRVYNDSGSAITNGKAVYVTGTEGVENRMTIDLARADSETTSKVIGLATHDIEDSSFGYITTQGQVNSIDTSAFTSGDVLYLDESTAGDLRVGKPPSGNYEIQIGFVNEINASTGSVFVLLNEELALAAGDAEEIIIQARKGSAGTINPGQLVYVSGWNNGQSVVEVELAQADAAATMPALGFCRSSITNSSTGTIVVSGNEAGLDTSGMSENDPVYVDPSTPGAFTNVKPTGTNLIQKVGLVTRSNVSNGRVQVVGAGRSNDLPNVASANFWLGNASGVATAVSMSGDSTMDNTGAVQVSDLTISSEAQGDILYFNGSNWVRLAPGTSGDVLQTNGAAANPSWVTPSAGTTVIKGESAGISGSFSANTNYTQSITMTGASTDDYVAWSINEEFHSDIIAGAVDFSITGAITAANTGEVNFRVGVFMAADSTRKTRLASFGS